MLQYQTRDDLNSDFDSLELSLEKRFSDRWSGARRLHAGYANDVVPQNAALNARVANDLEPARRLRARQLRQPARLRHERQRARRSADSAPARSSGYYSGYPINETIGTDVNGDRDNNDRPVSGVHDLTMPILSPLDANGRAIRNGIDGNSTTLVDLQLQYVFRLQQRQTVGLFSEIYNLFNKENLGNPTGNRNNRELHGSGRGRVDAVGAARDSVHVLESEFGTTSSISRHRLPIRLSDAPGPVGRSVIRRSVDLMLRN